MKYPYYRNVSYAAVWSWRFIIFSFTLLFVLYLFYRWNIVVGRYLYPFLILLLALAFCSAIFSVIGFTDLWRFGDIGGRYSLLGGAGSFILFLGIGFLSWQSFYYPPISQLSTDLNYPPPFIREITPTKSLLLLEFPEKITLDNELQNKYWPQLTSKYYDQSVIQVRKLLLRFLQKKEMVVISQELKDKNGQDIYLLQTHFGSFLLPHLSDIVIRIMQKNDKAQVDVRSQWKRGFPDFGFNASLLKSFLQEIDDEIVFQAPDLLLN